MQVVRVGEPSEVVRHAELYLLLDPRSLPMFELGRPERDAQLGCAHGPDAAPCGDTRERGLPRAGAVTADEFDGDDRFVRYHRVYDAADQRLGPRGP